MSLFSRVRRLNGSAASPEPDPSAPAGPDAVPAIADSLPELDGVATPRAATVSALRDSLQQLYAIRPSRDAFAEEAIKLIAKGAGVKAAALLGYEQRGARMHLLAHIGLDSDAVQILGGSAMVSAWDIPLRCLHNRRINVIEAAHENPFVPRPLLGISPRRLTIAALPFFHASAPVGVVVLFSPTARAFADGLLKSLSQSLRVCALALSELPAARAVGARPGEDDATGTQPNLLRGLAALKAELVRLTEALDDAERQRATEATERVTAQSFLRASQERTAQLEADLAAARAASERLPAADEDIRVGREWLAAANEALHTARAEIEQLQSRAAERAQRVERDAAAMAELTAARAELEQQLQSARDATRAGDERLTALQTQIAELEPRAAQCSDLQRALAAAEAARAESEALVGRTQAELRAAEQRERSAQKSLEQASGALAASERERTTAAQQLGDTHSRLSELAGAQAELAALREQWGALSAEHAARITERDSARAALAAAEQHGTALADQGAALQREADAAHAARTDLEARLAEQHAAADQLSVERRDLQARIDALTAGGQSLEHERQTVVSAAQRRAAELEAEIGRLSAALEATRSSAAAELERTRREAAATLDALRVELADAARGREDLQRALARIEQESAAHQRAWAELSEERARLQAGLEQSHNERAGTEKQLVVERDARQIAEQAFAAAEARYQDEIAALRDQLAEFNDAQARLAKELEEKQLLLQSAEQDLTATIDLSAEPDDEDAVLGIDRDYAPESATPDVEVLSDVEAAAGGDCILLDGEAIADSAARQLAEFGHRVSALAPSSAASDALRGRSVACAAVNLATAQTWSLLRHLRNGSGIARMPLVAYALADNAARGFWLGPVDFALLPVDQCDLAAMLNRLAPKLKRVIAMSNDIDVMSDVRSQLTTAGVSTAVVLDGRQALDLVATIRPEAAVLHLSPTCADVFRAIAGLRSAEITRDIPLVFLLDAEAQPREEAFLTAGVKVLSSRGTLAPDALVDSLASAFELYRAV
jgi:chromosome segregation ATPase/CheY-like chemotaxis protein